MFEVVSKGRSRKAAKATPRSRHPVEPPMPERSPEEDVPPAAIIKVVGVGGCGGNAVDHLSYQGMCGVEFICANTDAQALSRSLAERKLMLGSLGEGAGGRAARGLGAGGNPQIGREAAEASRDAVAQYLEGSDMVFIAAGMGGGTGTGGAPVVAKIAREMGVLTVAVVTRPFDFVGKKQKRIAEEGLNELEQHVDSLIAISNARMLSTLGSDANMKEAMHQSDQVLCGAVRGIADLITQPGLINLDFADVRTVMAQAGKTIMGTGQASGPERASDAVERAINSPLLEETQLHDARGILFNITVTEESFSTGEMQEIGQRIEDLAADEADCIHGVVFNDSMGDELRVTVVAAGLSRPNSKPAILSPVSAPATAPRQQPLWERGGGDSRSRRTKEGYGDYDMPSFLRKQAD